MKLVNVHKKQSSKRPLKRSMTGLEIETFLMDEGGRISYNNLELIKRVLKQHPKAEILKECGRNMIEFGCYPSINTYNPAIEIIGSLEKTIGVAEGMGLRLFPFGTYPGSYRAEFTPDRSGGYRIKKKIFGKERFALATKAVGFHHHYALPKGVFDYAKKNIKMLFDSKLQRSMLNAYNFEIAIDPVLTLLMQSSPFIDGRNLAKDCRMLIYRGGKKLKYPKGLYADLQQLGGLPPYKQTETDLINSLKRRREIWKKKVNEADPSAKMSRLYPYNLDIGWNPVKINKQGTLEQRGMDMNFMSVLLGVSALLKFCLKKIQREFIEVIPSDIGIKDPFRIRKGIMFIPPQTHVRVVYQKMSAYEGFESDELFEYAKRFFTFAKSVTPDFYYPILKKIESMIAKRRSISDEMLSFAKRKKYLDAHGNISDENAAEFALHYSRMFESDLKRSKAIVKRIMKTHNETP